MTRLDEMFEDHEAWLGSMPAGTDYRMIGRRWAADILDVVAKAGAIGHAAPDVSLEEIGWALYRILGNYDEAAERAEAIKRVRQGYLEADRWYKTGQRPDRAGA